MDLKPKGVGEPRNATEADAGHAQDRPRPISEDVGGVVHDCHAEHRPRQKCMDVEGTLHAGAAGNATRYPAGFSEKRKRSPGCATAGAGLSGSPPIRRKKTDGPRLTGARRLRE